MQSLIIAVVKWQVPMHKFRLLSQSEPVQVFA